MKMLKLFSIFAIFNTAELTGPNSDTCNQFREAYFNICGEHRSTRRTLHSVPGKRGPKGGKGDIGPIGPQPIVDYESINEKIHSLVAESSSNATSAIIAKLDKVHSRWEKEFCPVHYRNKCFRVVVHFQVDVPFTEAQFLCENAGWKLANIYDRNHYRLIESYMRSRISIASSASLRTWTAMTWNRQENRPQLSNGDFFSPYDAMWHEGFPSSSETYTRMGIMFRPDPNSKHQGIYNYPPSSNRHGALCEL